MTFNCLIVREYGDPTEEVMYPRADEVSRSIVLTPLDGGAVKRAIATRVEMAHQGKTKRHRQLDLDSMKAEIVVTDARVGFAIPKYDKGGGWIGGAGALALNAVSKARAAIRSRGTCLVGHLHYPWVFVVGHSAHFSMMGNRKHDQLRLGYTTFVERSKVLVWIEFDLSRDVSGHAVAQEIAQRTARHRLSHNHELTTEDREVLQGFCDGGIPAEVTNGSWTQVLLPGSYAAKPSTATYAAPEQNGREDAGSSREAGSSRDAGSSREAGSSRDAGSSGEAEIGPLLLRGPVSVPAAERGPGPTANWYPDPLGEHRVRYWDGRKWTENVAD